MWTSLCNFLCNKFFPRPEIGYQRSNDNTYNGFYGKRLKLFDRIWDPTGFLGHSRFCSMQKENVEISDDEDDCWIIAEIPRRKKAGSSIAVNTSPDQSNSTPNSHAHRFYPPIVFKTPSKSNDNDTKDIEEVKYMINSGKILNNKLEKRKFFSTPRSSLSQGKLVKTRFSFKNQLRRKMNFLQQSYRLTEKIQYIQLLQSHTLYNFFTSSPSSKNAICAPKEIEVIDISDDKKVKEKADDQDIEIVAEVSGIRSFQDILKLKKLTTEIEVQDISSDDSQTSTEKAQLPDSTSMVKSNADVDVSQKTEALEEKLRSTMQITSHEAQEVESTESYHLPELTSEQEKKIKNALILEPKQEVLSEDFGLKITRQDMQTLAGLNWLNDEIINFYMNLIVERNKKSKSLPKVYAFNTFFFPKLVSDGYTSLKRWTKKVDIFSFDLILVPIHLGMHWCLSVIDFRLKSVKYYDSIGSPNDKCTEKLLTYLKAESLDKRKKLFFTIDWKTANVEDIPQQMNGSDCGVFSCMFAEHLARGCAFLFTQDDMPYFRKKMVIEILEKKLLT